MNLRAIWMAAAAAVLSAAGAPSRTIRWTISTPEDYQKGTVENVVVSSTGELSLGPVLVRHDSGELSLWSSAVDEKTGVVYFGSGIEGKIFRLDRGGQIKEVGRTGELVVTALAWGPGGRLYAATIPAGKVFSLDPAEGKLSPVATLPDPYVWSLASAGGALVAGTGPNGKVYRIDAEGKAALWCETGQSHVLSLAADQAGSVYAGTSPNGVLFKIAPDGKGAVVFNTEEQEIRAMAWGRDCLWIGANKSKRFDPKRFVRRLQAAAAQAQQGEEKESPFQDLFDGSIYRMVPGSPARLVHSFSRSYLTSLAVDARGAVYAGTGDEGQVWRLGAEGTPALLAKLKESQAMTLAVSAGELAAIGTGNPGTVSATSAAGPRTGSFTSEILDAKFPAVWGSLSWDATGRLAVQTRSGRTARPDDGTWSEWSEPLGRNPSKVPSPAGRYFQVRFTWKDDPGAVLRWVTLFYKTENQQPDVREMEVESFDDASAFLGKFRESAEVVARWKAADPDGDELVFRVYFQRHGREEWAPLTPEPLAKKEFKWDTRLAADGWYRLKVVASDETANPGESALSGAKVSRPFLIDNREPAFENVRIAGGVISGAVTDETSVVARIEYSLDAGPWRFALPTDGLYDERSERFSIPLPAGLSAGIHHASIRAFDGGGNVTVYQESFRQD